MTKNHLVELLDSLQLPPHIHATILTDTDVHGTHLAVPVVWADRTTSTCPGCEQRVSREVEECPLALDGGAGAGGQIENRDLAHHCGQWLPVLSQVVEVDIDSDDAVDQIEQAAAELEVVWWAELQRAKDRVTKRLIRQLRWAMDALSTPLDEGEDPLDRIGRVTDGIRDTGEQVEPGLYLDPEAGAFVAWDYDPADPADAELLEERVDTVTYGQAATMLGVTRQRVGVLVAEGKLERGQEGSVTVASVVARMRKMGILDR